MSLSCRRILSGIVIVSSSHLTQTGRIQMTAVWNSARKGLICAAALLLLCNFTPAQGQDDHHPQRGFNPGNSYALSDIETISMSSGNLTLNVPLGSLPAGRGGSTGFRLSLTYNSKLYDSHIEEITNEHGEKENQTYLKRSLDGGWRYTLPAGYVVRMIKRGTEEPLPACINATGAYYYQKHAYIYKMQVIYPDGSAHEFRPTGYTDLFSDGYFNISPNGWISAASLTPGSNVDAALCTYNEYQGTTGPMVYYSTDGSYTRLLVEHSESGGHSGASNGWTLYFPDGSRVGGSSETEPQRMYDRNNNYVDLLGITYNNHPAKKIVDQLGRYIIIETDQANNQDYVYMQGVAGAQLKSTVKWKMNYVRKEYVATVEGEHRPNAYNAPLHMAFRVVDQIILPAQAGGLNYTFGYNGTDQDLQTLSPGWGELKSVTLPSGAKATYAYALDGVSAAGGGSAIFPTWKNVQNNKPKVKQLTYRQEYDLSSPVSNSPCDPQSEACTTEEWVYGLEGVLPIILTQDSWITKLKGPDGGVLEEYVGDDPNSPSFNRAVKTIRPDGTMTEHIWAQNRSAGMTGQVVNPYLKTEFTSIKDAAGNYVKTAIKDYSYDKNGNVTEVREYDWVSFGSVLRDVTGGPTGIPSSAPLKRITSNGYYNPTPDASNTTTISPNAYHQASAKQLLNAIESSEVSDGEEVLSRAEFSYDNFNTTGNLTEQRGWDSTKPGITHPLTSANAIVVTTQYDPLVLGKVTQTTDALGTRTEYIYGSINGFADLYPTETRVAAGTAVQRTTQQEYDFWTGLVKRATDVDNNVSTSTTYDDLGRPTLVRAAENKGEETRTRTEYNDTLRQVIVRSDLTAAGDEKLVAIQHYDQLSRIRLTRQLEDAATQSVDDETQGIKVQTRYKYSGVNSYQVSSQPYREASSSQAPAAAMGWSRAKADNSGRLMEVQQFGGNSLPAPWSSNTTGTGQVVSTYDANTTTVMDQAGKVRRSVTDGLGRLVRVDEPDPYYNLDDAYGVPLQSTSYTYDALDNLTSVSQGTQTRTFVYDSLKRLTSATNPESGRICYGTVSVGQCQANGYDANGNLIYKTDARGVLSTYAYDVLNRNTSVTYTNDPAGTPTVHRYYDGLRDGINNGVPNSKGRLWQTETSGSAGSRTTINGFDALGRPVNQSQQLYSYGAWSQSYSTFPTYDKAGHVLSLTYPSAHTVTYTYDGAGRTISFRGTLGENTWRDYSTEMAYSSMGALTKEKFGTDTPIFNKLFYNSRGQLAEIRESTTSAVDTSWDRGAIINHYSNNYGCWGASCNAPDNNGNLMRQEVYIPRASNPAQSDNFAQFYDYDSLNRLRAARETFNGVQKWQQTYSYDRYGNRTINTAANQTWGIGINNREFAVEPTTNRLYAPEDLALTEGSRQMQYDAAGNLKKDVYSSAAVTRVYDAENRMISETQANNSTVASYTYNGDGQRVRRRINDVETWQVYGVDGELLAEYAADALPYQESPQVENGYRNGQLLIAATLPQSAGVGEELSINQSYSLQPNLALHWLVTDQLGTPRMVIDKTGSLAGVSRHDYLPFGEELFAGTGRRTSTMGYTAADGVRQKFTQKERDIETGLDYFGARYYGSTQGRFISPDPLLSSGRLENPQTWNRYPYTLNNPLTLVDPTGLFSFGSNLSDDEKKKITDAYNNLKAALGKLQQGSKAYKSIERSLARLGEPGKVNGVVVTIGSVKFAGGAATDVNNVNKGTVTIKFDEKSFSNSSAENDAANLGHEGVHADDAFNLYSQSKSMAAFARAWESNGFTYRSEYDAYFASAGVYQALRPDQTNTYGYYANPDVPGKARNILQRLDLWNPSWATLDIKVIESKQGSTIMTKLEAPDRTPYSLRGYNLKRPRGFQP